VLGLDGEVGSLAPGKWADLTVVSLEARRSSLLKIPLWPPVSAGRRIGLQLLS
jgi:imidazolonepropionase-like amidohydrolase